MKEKTKQELIEDLEKFKNNIIKDIKDVENTLGVSGEPEVKEHLIYCLNHAEDLIRVIQLLRGENI